MITFLQEVIKAFNSGEALAWHAIIFSPPAICGLAEARNAFASKNVYITDKLVNAKEISEKADMLICHGGQGTLQTAIAGNTPLIGLATQAEQQINLEHLADFGMAKSISVWNWYAKNIRRQACKVLSDSAYKARATELNRLGQSMQTRDLIGESIWKIMSKYG